MHDCVTDEQFEKYDRGELGEIELRGVRKHLAECEKCRTAYERRHSSVPLPAADTTQAVVRVPKESSSPVEKAPRYLPKIEGYRITGVLGQGGMGIVYRAVQTNLNRAVALKVLPSIVGSASPAAVQRFRREATAAARLHHTHIVPIYDFGECRDAYYYTMELIEGQPLNEMIKTFAEQNISTASPARLAEVLHHSTTGALPVQPVEENAERSSASLSSSAVRSSSTGRGRAYYQQIAHWIADAADALHYAHGQGIIHRDIKPGNLIISTDGRIMITDFGLAKSVDEKSVTITGSLLGTMRYLSPEQAMAKRMAVDHRTDIYSLGATLYELLAFQPAFPGTDEKQILAAIITRDPAPPRKITPQVPAELETICLKTLEKSADARYATARALAEDLRRYLNDLPIVAKRPNLIRRTAKFVRRHRAMVTAGVAAFLLAIALIFAWQLDRARRTEKLEGLTTQAALHENKREWREAADDYRHALSLSPDDPLLLGNLSRSLQEVQDRRTESDQALIEEAIAHCEKARRLQPNPRLENVYGVLLSMGGRYQDALEVFQKDLDKNQTPPWVWLNIAAVHFLQKDDEAALVDLQKSIQNPVLEIVQNGVSKEKPYSHGYRELATFQLMRRDKEAARTIETGIDLGTDGYFGFHLVQARILLTLQSAWDPYRAMVAAETARNLWPEHHPYIERYLALAYLRHEAPAEKALAAATRAKEYGDLPVYADLLIASAEARLGNKDRSRSALQEAIKTWPEDLKLAGATRRSRYLGMLWFESADELLGLRQEAERALE